MKRALSVILILTLLLAFPLTAYAANAVPGSVIKASESVVRIITEYSDSIASGSGFVIKSSRNETLIATNYHVVEGKPIAVYIYRGYDEPVQLKMLAFDKQKDICVLRAETPLGLSALKFDQSPRQGEVVYAIGFPGAADDMVQDLAYKSSDATITDGIISSIRQSAEYGKFESYQMLQINAAINHGNSGGPLLNSKGRVLGINTCGMENAQGIFGAVAVEELSALLAANGIRLGGFSSVFLIAALVAPALLVLAALVLLLLKRGKREKKQTALTLPQYMAALGRPMTPPEAVAALMPVLKQLRDMHESGRAHLQINPASIELGKNHVQLAEAGAGEANFYNSGFAAPEIYKGKNYGAVTDVYSISAVLFYMLTGSAPENALVRLEQDKNEIFRSQPGIEDEELRELLSMGLEPDHNRRFVSVQALITALTPYNFNMHINESPFAPAETAPRERKPRRERKERRPVNKRRVAVICAASIAAAFVLSYFGCYLGAGVSADKGNFTRAEDLLFLPGLTVLHDENMLQYVEAGLSFQRGDYAGAEQRFRALSGYRASSDMVNESMYRYAGVMADQGNFKRAIEYFTVLSSVNYKDSGSKILETKCLKAKALAAEGDYIYLLFKT